MSRAPKRKLLTRESYAKWPDVEIEVEPDKVERFPDYCGIAKDYAERCIDGRQPVCRWVQLGAKRYLKMLATAARPRTHYYWSPAHVSDVCSFLEKLPHIAGDWKSPTIILEPWQIFVCAAIYGFRRRESGVRLVRSAFIMVPRKNAKSTLSSGLALYALTCEGEVGPEIYIGAKTLEQAGNVFEPAAAMVRRDSDLAEQFGLKPLVREIRCATTGGSISTITSIAEAQDGHNSHMVVLEELHAQKAGLYQVMGSSFGARRNPLMLMITTAGRVPSGLCWEQLKRAEKLLRGIYAAPHEFAIIYTVDKPDKDRLYDEDVMMKANPMWGISVLPDNAREEALKAKNDPATRAEFMRTRVNVWSNADEALLQPDDWEACEDRELRIEQFIGQKCWMGVDLAKRRDMAAKTLIFECDDGKIAVFAAYYIPTDAPAFDDPDQSPMYHEWVEAKKITLTGKGIIDFNVIQTDIEADCAMFDVQVIAFDPYQANQMSAALAGKGLPAITFPNSPRNMAEPTDDMKSRVESRMIVHDGHPILAWNAMNVVGHADNRENILPKKDAPNSPRKIDGLVAGIFANGCRIQAKKPDEDELKKPHPWAVRGMLGFDEKGQYAPK